jgi:hypothetical protein
MEHFGALQQASSCRRRLKIRQTAGIAIARD